MAAVSKNEFDAHDRVIDAAAALAELIVDGGIVMDEESLERLTLFLANSGPQVRAILGRR